MSSNHSTESSLVGKKVEQAVQLAREKVEEHGSNENNENNDEIPIRLIPSAFGPSASGLGPAATPTPVPAPAPISSPTPIPTFTSAIDPDGKVAQDQQDRLQGQQRHGSVREGGFSQPKKPRTLFSGADGQSRSSYHSYYPYQPVMGGSVGGNRYVGSMLPQASQEQVFDRRLHPGKCTAYCFTRPESPLEKGKRDFKQVFGENELNSVMDLDFHEYCKLGDIKDPNTVSLVLFELGGESYRRESEGVQDIRPETKQRFSCAVALWCKQCSFEELTLLPPHGSFESVVGVRLIDVLGAGFRRHLAREWDTFVNACAVPIGYQAAPEQLFEHQLDLLGSFDELKGMSNEQRKMRLVEVTGMIKMMEKKHLTWLEGL